MKSLRPESINHFKITLAWALTFNGYGPVAEEIEKKPKKTPRDADTLKDIVALTKRRGFVFPGSEIYGGLSNTFDYGPYGVELMRNLRNLWWKSFVLERDDVVGLDSSIILHPKVWEASGHVGSFNDPLIDCKNCKSRFRADHILEETGVDTKKLTLESLVEAFRARQETLQCSVCGNKGTFTEPRQFNLMFSTKTGSVSGSDLEVYLRPETAQGIFINFKNITDTCRVKIPFGVAQVGKSFRNEIVARQFVFRTREFEQLELEFFCAPGSQKEWFEHWCAFCMNWLYSIGLKKENLRLRQHDPEERSHYSENTADIEYKFPFGWGELWGIASRTDYDLTQHVKVSKKNLEYFDSETNTKYIPYVVEPSLGLNRLTLAVLCDSYLVEKEGTPEQRIVLGMNPKLSPVKVGIFPLQKKDGLPELAMEIHRKLSKLFPVEYDVSGSIGKRYYRQDELGTPFCITVDYDSLKDRTVTVRLRDTTEQKREKIDSLPEILNRLIFS